MRLIDLTPDSKNARAHDERNVEMIVSSLKEVGAARSIVIDEDGTILAGNATVEAALKAGLKNVKVVETNGSTVVAVRRTGLTPEEKKRLALLDNRTAELATWDVEVLANIWQEDERLLQGIFDDDELADILGDLLRPEPEPDLGAQVDKAAELQEKWKVKVGDVWQCGEHFVVCGDCRESDTWVRLLAAAQVEKVNGVFTSPPYAEQRKKQYGGVPVDKYVGWWEAVQTNVRANLADDGSFFVNIKPHVRDKQRSLYVFDLVVAMARRWHWLFVDEFCWMRSGIPQQVVNRFKNQFEPVYWFANTSGYKFLPRSVMHYSDSVPVALGPGAGDTNAAKRQGRMGAIQGNEIVPGLAYPGNVLKGMHQKEVLGHAATFPVALPDFFIRAYSDPGDVWLDPFVGSGTTIVAAHQNERRGLGIEVLPKYVAVTLERLSGMGLEPELRSMIGHG